MYISYKGFDISWSLDIKGEEGNLGSCSMNICKYWQDDSSRVGLQEYRIMYLPSHWKLRTIRKFVNLDWEYVLIKEAVHKSEGMFTRVKVCLQEWRYVYKSEGTFTRVKVCLQG